MTATHSAADLRRIVDAARPAVFWSDKPGAPEPAPTLAGETTADLCIVGAGFSGLWAALQAIEAEPSRSIAVLEAEVCGFGASTRNGGFCEASLTHGHANGLNHWPKEMPQLEQLGRDNLTDLLATLDRLAIDAHIEHTGQITFAVADWQVDELREWTDGANELGNTVRFLEQDDARAEVNSPTYLAGAYDVDGAAMVDPALLTWGLRRACEERGVRFHDHSRVTDIEADGTSIRVSTAAGSVRADKVFVATNAWAEPFRQMRMFVIPIYDHVLMTEPLTDAQLGEIGWDGRQGLADAGNQFHYYRLTHDNRILWGGYDANYYKGNGMGPEYEDRRDSHVLIAGHFYETFPQLADVGFSHRWAGPIGTTSRFTPAFGSRFDGRVVWVAGYTGLGVGASRFGARVALDMLDGVESPITKLGMVTRKPIPFPPEPIRNPVVQFTRNQIAKADDNNGEWGWWLNLLDRFGIGFDS